MIVGSICNAALQKTCGIRVLVVPVTFMVLLLVRFLCSSFLKYFLFGDDIGVL